MQKETATEKDENDIQFRRLDVNGMWVSMHTRNRTDNLSGEATEHLEEIAESMEEKFDEICDDLHRIDERDSNLDIGVTIDEAAYTYLTRIDSLK